MSNYEATKYDFSGANLTGIEGIPTATIVPWSSASIPTGFLECNGQLVSRSTYSALFAIIGTTYGAGDGASALASTGGANTVQSTGNVGGSTANATLSTSQLASHSHTYKGQGTPGGNPGILFHNPGTSQFTSSSTGSGTGHSHNMSATFTGDSTSVLQPYVTIVYIIKT